MHVTLTCCLQVFWGIKLNIKYTCNCICKDISTCATRDLVIVFLKTSGCAARDHVPYLHRPPHAGQCVGDDRICEDSLH